MNVLMINGSPHKNGCTYTALTEVGKTLNEAGIDYEIEWVGREAVRGCQACLGCRDNDGACVFSDDAVNRLIDKLKEADALVVGSPVYYAGPNGSLTAILDRMFYAGGSYAMFKPGAIVCSARRGGTTATLDRLSKYMTISSMPLISSTYWPMVHGSKPEDVAQDEEGLQTMRNLGRNMAWILKCIEAGEEAGIEPEVETGSRTNFIR